MFLRRNFFAFLFFSFFFSPAFAMEYSMDLDDPGPLDLSQCFLSVTIPNCNVWRRALKQYFAIKEGNREDLYYGNVTIKDLLSRFYWAVSNLRGSGYKLSNGANRAMLNKLGQCPELVYVLTIAARRRFKLIARMLYELPDHYQPWHLEEHERSIISIDILLKRNLSKFFDCPDRAMGLFLSEVSNFLDGAV